MADWAVIPIRIEAASFEGRPVYFRVVSPWDEKPQGIVTTGNRSIFVLVVASILLIGVILLVWHNIKNGRADLRGTAKFGLFFLVAYRRGEDVWREVVLGGLDIFSRKCLKPQKKKSSCPQKGAENQRIEFA
jgi:hypothetical protein